MAEITLILKDDNGNQTEQTFKLQGDLDSNDQLTEVYSHRSEVVERLLAQECELCGSTEHCEVHHIRKLADLDKVGQEPKPLWVRRMAARQRKTLVVYRNCYEVIHREGASKRKQAA